MSQKKIRPQGNRLPAETLSRCVGCRQKVIQAIQNGELLPETCYSQIQADTNANGWDQTADTVKALYKEKTWKTHG